MVGHMVRQILEQRDWVLDQSDVKVQSVPFSKAARYRRPDWITFHAFRNTSDPRDVVITDRRQNPQLPGDARWSYYATFASPLKAAVAFGVGDIKQLRQQVHTQGFRRVRVERPFVRQLRKDLLAHGVPRVWLDEAEIEIGDSLIAKIDEGMKLSRYIAVVLSKKSIDAPWVKKELDLAMNREISTGEVVVLPLLYEECELPGFLKGKLYADFSKPEEYEAVLGKLLRRLRIA
ncbi:toll/interleukin-1 receptor domain-containing protein [Paracoccus tibetensis]|uniref:TIR domain-containing protein n=1 Tax=Paracoccus tibetensis TaxID=336292 RepID=A0A1G5FL12_9RHOB|nr:toll/interleukin-1 receptor domain-containing protein [Paracoccus tibetensis]SCY39949.1 TIR domain-containing protein [Paracoccus tibetensis]